MCAAKVEPMNKQTMEAATGGLADMGRDFVAGWKEAQRGGKRGARHRVYFADAGELFAVLTPGRLTLLRALAQHTEGLSVLALAKALKRDYKNVHADAARLEAHGLIGREGRKLVSPYHSIQAAFELGRAA